jgi:phenylalanyl-tRNA synthetase beta chain
MKLSLAWIFDHIDADWRHQNIDEIVKRFNAVTAEIEEVEPYCIDLEPYTMAHVESVEGDICSLLVPEHNQTTEIIGHPGVAVGCYYMLKRVNDYYEWATPIDFHVEKKGFLPAFDVTSEQAVSGSWKQLFEHDDIIIDVDNKSITHRPDMWGHRGFAREIAAFMHLPFKESAYFLKERDVVYTEKRSTPTATNPYIIDNQAPDKCSQFCGLYYPACSNRPSPIKMASRLLKVGARPINALVDITNYLMFDWSQPVHAYDADKIVDRKLIVRTAGDGESLMLLGDEEVSLVTEDLVIADAQKPLGLAGAKGGKHDSISDTTTSIFFEAATFDAASVRRSAARHKMRTDSSARFEKTLNEEQALEAVFRFQALLDECGIEATAAQEVVVVGSQKKPLNLLVAHSFLEQRSGLTLEEKHVVDPLVRLGFVVVVEKKNNDVEYKVTVPPFRASKDISIKEDILEEVVRSYGYDRIPLKLPLMTNDACDISSIMRLRKIKQFISRSARMTEQQNYSLYDESFLKELGLELSAPIELKNPVSENMSRLVTSLIPGLLKNVRDNHVQKDSVAFFECGRIWRGTTDDVCEQKTLAGIILNKHKEIDFYDTKALIVDLATVLSLPVDDIVWHKIEQANCPAWLSPFQTAELHYQNNVIGVVGRMSSLMIDKLGLSGADGMIFELDNDFLLREPEKKRQMKSISKFQETSFDVSLLVPLQMQAASLFDLFNQADELIIKTELIDFFEHASWHDVRSLTFRFWLSHAEKTLEKEEIDAVRERVLTIAMAHGTRLRA